ncbi:transposase OrfA [Brucella ovis ATCC 25840]|uniref:Transposase OrfA n=1 Tax=Brucella ovis (strain ATCC 25840 / 63/290 / NCTC 10512) TaxID=444178 RepID=A0A0H3ANI3_BRUO2|nr:transposase OrfA [Brucella ovis ATCC 25840]ABQ61245.1 transposase OrfA [Brucella ovis ATCC 25840]
MSNGTGSKHIIFRGELVRPAAVALITDYLSTPSCGWLPMQRTGAICLRPSANGQRFMPAFGAGRTPVYGKGFSMPWLIRRTLNMSSLIAPYRKSTQMRRAQKGG